MYIGGGFKQREERRIGASEALHCCKAMGLIVVFIICLSPNEALIGNFERIMEQFRLTSFRRFWIIM